MGNVLAIRARRNAPALSAEESGLFLRINRTLPPATQRRYDELIGKRRDETLTEEEHRELLDLTQQSERINAERIEALAELARLRGTTLDATMDQLGIRPPADE